ncbi:unnamed protein product [Amoebophrya sp. A25]|nr:unnamed protein product [Amoebophrya sp. A25]|eukprot:GSA25T00024409001.1
MGQDSKGLAPAQRRPAQKHATFSAVILNLAVFATGLDEGGFSYDYNKHGADWVAGMCSSTERQSPVSLQTAGLTPTGNLPYSYVPLENSFELKNNGHTLSGDLMGLGLGGISYGNGWYNVLSVNFHSPSEHVWDGMQFPLEAHLVHKRSDSDHLIMVAVPFGKPLPAEPAGAGSAPEFLQRRPVPAFLSTTSSEQMNSRTSTSSSSDATTTRRGSQAPAAPAGAASLPAAGSEAGSGKAAAKPGPISAFALNVPEIVGQTVFASPPMDLSDFYGGDGQFIEYSGSLTAPPCAETATWFVRTAPVDGDELEVHKLQQAILTITGGHGNNRATRPLNGRPVALRAAVREEVAAQPSVSPTGRAEGGSAGDSSDATDPNAPSKREYQALMWAKEAMDEARVARDHAANLDEKLRVLSEARADVHTAIGSQAGALASAAAGAAATATAAVNAATGGNVNQIATPLAR